MQISTCAARLVHGQLSPTFCRSNVATCYTHAYPNAGLPNAMGGYDLKAQQMAPIMRQWAIDGLINMVGGCCGTTPEHIKAIADAVSDLTPTRRPPGWAGRPPAQNDMLLSGLEDMKFPKGTVFQNIGERCNVAGSIRFKKLVLSNDWCVSPNACRRVVSLVRCCACC